MFTWQDLFIIVIFPLTIWLINNYIKKKSLEYKIVVWFSITGHLLALVVWLFALEFLDEPKDSIAYTHDARLLNYHLTHYSELTPEIWKRWQFQPETWILQARVSPDDLIIYSRDGATLLYAKILAVLLWFTGHSLVVLWFLLAVLSSYAHLQFVFWVSKYFSGHVFLQQLLLLFWPSILTFSIGLTKELLLFPAFIFCWIDSYNLLSAAPKTDLSIVWRVFRWVIACLLLIMIKLYLFVAVWGVLALLFILRFAWQKARFRWWAFLLVSLTLGYHLHSKQFSFFYTIHQAYSTRQSFLGDECALEASRNTLTTPSFKVNYAEFFTHFPEAIIAALPGPLPNQVNSRWLKALCVENILLSIFFLVAISLSVFYIRKIPLNEATWLFLALIFCGVVLGGYMGLSIANAGSLMRYRIYALLPLLAGLWGITNQACRNISVVSRY